MSRPSPGATGRLGVTIVNCAPDHNKGACAIAWGLINRLVSSGLVDRISVLSLFKEITPALDYRHLTARFPEVAVLPSPVSSRAELLGSSGRWVRGTVGSLAYAPYIMARTAMLHRPRFREGLARRSAGARALVAGDLVIDRGGPFFAAFGPPPNPSLQVVSWPLLFAREAGLPYGVVGESVGPFANPWARRATRRLLEGAGLVGVRDEFSKNALMKIGIREHRIVAMLDNAFWVEPRNSSRVAEILRNGGLETGRFLAVTCRPWPGIGARYLAELACTIDALVPSLFDRVALVCNTFNPGGPHLDDRAITRALLPRVAARDRVVLVEDDLAPDELASLYGSASLVLGARLHSVVLALVGGSRAVALSYVGTKTQGIMGLLGLADYVLDMMTFDAGSAADAIRRALADQPAVGGRIEALRREGDAVLGDFLGRLVERRSASDR